MRFLPLFIQKAFSKLSSHCIIDWYCSYPASSATDIQDNQELFPEDPNDRHQLLQGRKSEMQNVGLRW